MLCGKLESVVVARGQRLLILPDRSRGVDHIWGKDTPQKKVWKEVFEV